MKPLGRQAGHPHGSQAGERKGRRQAGNRNAHINLGCRRVARLPSQGRKQSVSQGFNYTTGSSIALARTARITHLGVKTQRSRISNTNAKVHGGRKKRRKTAKLRQRAVRRGRAVGSRRSQRWLLRGGESERRGGAVR